MPRSWAVLQGHSQLYSFQTSTERNRWLPLYLAILNDRRCHIALAGRNPIRSLNSCWLLNDLLRKTAKSAGLALCHSERYFLGVRKNSLSGWKQGHTLRRVLGASAFGGGFLLLEQSGEHSTQSRLTHDPIHPHRPVPDVRASG